MKTFLEKIEVKPSQEELEENLPDSITGNEVGPGLKSCP